MRRPLLVLLVSALAAAACGGGRDHTTTTTSTTHRRTTTSTTTSSSSTTSRAACDRVTVPAGATDTNEATGDVDGDRRRDTLRSYRVGAAEWHLQVSLVAGGGADVVVTTYPDDTVAVLGGADVDGDGADEVWARTGSGASATILGLARFEHCALTRVTFGGGGAAELPVGGSVGTASGLACQAHLDPTADLSAYTATNTGDDRYEVRSVEYALEGTALVQTGTETTTATAGDAAFGRATSFTCRDLSL
ncbi:MAG: hypothetical protein ABIY48_07930 [Acidimicrobiales bacterium]